MEQVENSRRSQRRNKNLLRERMSVAPSAAAISCQKRIDPFPLDLIMEIALVTLM